MKKIHNLILLAILLVLATPCLAQQLPPQTVIYHGTTLDQVPSIVAGIQNAGNPLNQAGLGLNVSTNYQAAQAMANLRAAQNAAAGLSGSAAQPIVLEGVLTDGATSGNFFIKQSANFSNLGQQVIGNDVSFSQDVQNALYKFDVLIIDGTEADPTKTFMVLHESANDFVAWANGPAPTISLVPTSSQIAQAEQQATSLLSNANNVVAFQGDQVSAETAQALQNASANPVSNCGWYCGLSALLAGSWTNLKIGLQMYGNQAADTLLTGGMGGVSGMAAVYGLVQLCDSNADNLCSNNINISLSNLLFTPNSGATLVSQTINPYTGVIERDFSDGSTNWTRTSGIASGVTAAGVGWVQDPQTGTVGIATPLDGLDPRSSEIMQVNFAGTIKYLTPAGFSDTLDDAQTAVNGVHLLNSLSYEYPAISNPPSVVPVLDPNGKPAPLQQNSTGTVTTTGTTPDGSPYTTTVQKDSSGNVVSENTVVYGTNFTTSKNDLTGTSLTIQRNPDGSTSIFNCIGKGTVCATDSGIVNFDDGWGGKNPYDASNQTFSLTMPGGGGGGGGPLLNAVGDPTVHPGGCTELGC